MNSAVIGKIAKVMKGLPHFAEVELNIDNGPYEIICRCSGNGFQGQGIIEDASVSGYDDWIKSAKDGVSIGFQMAKQTMANKVISIQRISGLDGTDTNPDTVKCAAIIAVWNWLKFEASDADMEFINQTLQKSWDKFRIA